MNHSLPPVSIGRGDCPPPSPRSPLASALLSAVTTVALLSGSFALSAGAQVAVPEQGTEPTKPAVAAETDPDAIGQTVTLDTFVVSGTIAPRRQLDSAAAITTIDFGQIQAIAPVGLPELIKHIPGIMVNTAGGETRSNVISRGIPATGGFVFVGLQQDGLPDISEMNFRNLFADLMVRSSTFTERVENVRGGTAGIFQNNVPGGIINLISREGTSVRRGEIMFTTTDYNQLKTDAWISGPINDSTTYAAGFNYRQDDGVRSTGYTANKGYIVQGNVKHTFANGRGSLKLSAKWMSDGTTFFMAVPMQNASHPHSIPGFNARTDTQHSRDLRSLTLPNTPDGNLSHDTVDPIKLATLSAVFELKLNDNWRLQDRYRYTNYLQAHAGSMLTSGVATPIQSFVNTLAAASGTQFAAAKSGANYSYRLHYPGEGGAVVADPTAMNGNGLAMNLTYSAAYSYIYNNQNDLRLIRTLPNNGAIAFGLYNSWLKMPKARTYNMTMVTEVRNNPRRLDVELLNATTGASLGYATYNGLRQVSTASGYRNYSTDQKDIAPFINIEQPVGNWTLDAGVRHEKKKETLVKAGTKTYNLNVDGANIPALRNAGFSDGVYTPYSYDISATTWTTGANYRFNSRFSAYGRFMSGYRMPISDDFLNNILAGKIDPGPTNRITQLEGGVKYATKKLSVFATLIGSQLRNQVFDGLAAQPDGSLVSASVLRDTDSYGLELEMFYTPLRSLTLHFIGTEQRVSITSDNLITNPANTADVLNIKGNRIRNIPERYLILDASYRFPEFSFGQLSSNLSFEYTGNTPIDEANRAFVPAYSVLNGGLSFKHKKVSCRLTCRNLLGSDALINGDARSSQTFADPTAVYLNARPILPRTLVGSVTYSF